MIVAVKQKAERAVMIDAACSLLGFTPHALFKCNFDLLLTVIVLLAEVKNNGPEDRIVFSGKVGK